MKKNYIFLLIILVCFFQLLSPAAGKIKFDHLPIKISMGGISSIIEDNRGIMWIGSFEGLYKYDGHRYTVYKPVPGDPNSISDGFISKLYLDREKLIWICTNNGLSMYNTAIEKFSRFYPDPINKSSASNNITSIFEDQNGMLWIGTGEGLYQFDRAEKKFKLYKGDISVTNIVEDKLGTIWVGTTKGLLQFDKNQVGILNLEGNLISIVSEGSSGDILIGTDKDFGRYDKKTGVFVSYKKLFGGKSLVVSSIFEDSKGCLWIGTMGSGLYILDKDKTRFDHYPGGQNNPGALRGRMILSIFMNRSGIIWLGTDSQWLELVSPAKIKYEHFFIKSSKGGSKITNRINSLLLRNSNELLAGSTFNGLFLFKNQKFTDYVINLDDKTFFDEIIISSICQGKDNSLWVGTVKGLLQINETNQSVILHRHNPRNHSSVASSQVLKVYKDKSGIIWVGTTSGLDKYNPETRTFEHYIHNPQSNNSLSHNVVINIYEDSLGDFWICTLGGGVNKFNKKDQSFIRYINKINDPHSLSNNRVVTLLEDRNKNIWFGTLGGGLNKYDRQNDYFEVFTEKDGLLSNLISGLIEDHSGNIWIATTKGISILNPGRHLFRNFNIGAYNLNTSIINKDGDIFLGGLGLYKFPKNCLKTGQTESPIILTNFKIFNEPVPVRIDGSSPLSKNISETSRISLDYNQNVFSFEFSILDFSTSGSNRYTYKMDGFSDKWIDLGNKSDITFTNLDPGRYVFQVKGKSSSGLWNKEGVAVEVIIKPPFWMTWWFKGCIILLIAGIVVYFYRWRIQKIEIKIEKDYILNQFYAKHQLSKREIEIIELIIKAKSNREIEDLLFISYHTVRSHLKNIYRKLSINNRSELILRLNEIHSKTSRNEN